MVTYGDMVTLLLTFFVLLLSFATMDEVKFDEAAHSLKGALGILEKYTTPMPERSLTQPPEVERVMNMDVYESIQELERLAEEQGFADDLYIEVTETGLLIQLGDKVLFDLGKADLRPAAYDILNLVGKLIRENANDTMVSGHTDNIPISNEQFASNWELSLARALRVVKYLINFAEVPPTVISAAGYSEYRPIMPNNSPENRQKNRRVEFLVNWN